MNQDDIFRAIGNTEDTWLLESEAASRRPRWKTVLLAAVIAALTLTACAVVAPVILGSIQEATLEYVGPLETKNETSAPEENRLELISSLDRYSVIIDFELSEDLPTAIETVYLPTDVPDEWWGELFYKSGDHSIYGHWFEGDWDSMEDYTVSVMYQQTLLSDYDPETKEIHGVAVAEGCTVESRTLKVGEQDVLEVSLKDNVWEYYHPQTGETIMGFAFDQRHYYWSDGEYLFYLAVPSDTGDDMIGAFVASLTPGEMPILPIDKANVKKSSSYYMQQAWEAHCQEQGIDE